MKKINPKTLFWIIVPAIALAIFAVYFFVFQKKTNPYDPANTSNIPSGSSTAIKPSNSITTPTVSNTKYDALPNGAMPIIKGQKSKLVYLLQYALNALYNSNLTLDGNFGNITEAALFAVTGKYEADNAIVYALAHNIYLNKSAINNADWFISEAYKFNNLLNN